MRLKHIKLAGFKSFVDPTKVLVSNNLIGIVGPNGCGKSNVIDAIRWVMGESSAKTLRGDSMDDVIFNGSSVRKPVNKASVELVFDNSSGKAPGSYAKFAEIAIRRELTRDGGSKYFINKGRCRRKDIQDIFLGTGLGPRSYSIIEQGMVGRIVESKPEELRVLIEEAAGISKYKDRRRETENRIRHTRENLSRVEDIIGELETQLRRLKRQANDAERYKTFKERQRELNQQQKTLQWSGINDKVQLKDVELERLQTEFEAHQSQQRDVETNIESMRQQQNELTEKLNKVQAEYYSIGGEVAAVEQNIAHVKQTRQQQQDELTRLQKSEQEATAHLKADESRLVEVTQQKTEVEPLLIGLNKEYQQAESHLHDAEQSYQTWQQRWEEIHRDSATPEKERDVQSARIEQHERQITQFAQRVESLANSLQEIDQNLNQDEINALKESVTKIDQECLELEKLLQDTDAKVTELRSQLETHRESYNQKRHSLQDDSARLNSLKALQEAALGENREVNHWLAERGLSDRKRLASLLQVEPGWEKAVDTVLGSHINALSVDSLDKYADQFTELSEGAVLLLDGEIPQAASNTNSHLQALADKVAANQVQVVGWLHGVYITNTIEQALQQRKSLQAHESIVTQDGCWLGPNWVAFGEDQDPQKGVLQRDAEIETLQRRVEQSQADMQTIQAQGEETQQSIKQLESERETKRNEFRGQSHQRTDLHNQLGRVEARSAELLAQREKVIADQQSVSDQLTQAQDDLSNAKKLLVTATELAGSFNERRQQLGGQKDGLQSGLNEARQHAQKSRDQRQARQIELERLTNNHQSLTESVARLQTQLQSQAQRRNELAQLLDENEDPTADLQKQLQEMLESRLQVEQKLSVARNELADYENQMKDADQKRLGHDRQSQTVRESLDQLRLQRQELAVRRDTIAEQLDNSAEQMQLLQQELPDDIDLAGIEDELQAMARKLERIGAVNLVAIDEYEQCKERKVYLDEQHTDLTEAMSMLESAINKIDKETRQRFKETFDELNEGFKEFFPKLFGGGSAYLELTGNDMLDTGVGVMARPPGKRNSTIHLLSGGEKALTAVSLLFAFFELNPAPFCVLDEVDAPMDDANVYRYAQVLQQLGQKTQLLFITHNKITMEVSDILIGVTMAEAGVSRLVAVDIEAAAGMAME